MTFGEAITCRFFVRLMHNKSSDQLKCVKINLRHVMVSVIDHGALCLVGRGFGGSSSHCFYRVILIIFYHFSFKKKKKW